MTARRRTFTADTPDANLYRLLTAVVVPRPIAWVSSLSAAGVGNLAPHSFFTVSSADPPVVQFTSVGHKDTLRNVRETGEFTVSLATEPLKEMVNATSARYDATVDEAEALGLTMEPSLTVAPPRVADSPVSIECRRHSEVDLGQSVVVLGSVRMVTVVEEALDRPDDRALPSIAALRPVSRLGRNEWGLPPEVVRMDRPGTP